MGTERKADIVLKVGDVEIGLARPRLREAMLLDWLSSKLPPVTGVQWLYQYGWCKAMTRTVYIKGLDYAIPTMASDETEVRAAYEEFLNIDGDLAEKWGTAVGQLETPGTPLHERPMEDVPKELQTDPNSSSGVHIIPMRSSPL